MQWCECNFVPLEKAYKCRRRNHTCIRPSKTLVEENRMHWEEIFVTQQHHVDHSNKALSMEEKNGNKCTDDFYFLSRSLAWMNWQLYAFDNCGWVIVIYLLMAFVQKGLGVLQWFVAKWQSICNGKYIKRQVKLFFC